MRRRMFKFVVIALMAACNSSAPSNGQDLSAAGTDLSQPTGNCTPACTGANIVCDPADNKCKPDGTTSAVGAPCATSGADPACGNDPIATCNDQTQDGFPGGYCSYEPCTTLKLCPIGSSCAHLNGEANACFKNCTSDVDCRAPDYACAAIDPLYTAGASHKVCFLKMFLCVTSADCPAIKPTCSGANGDGGTVGVCT